MANDETSEVPAASVGAKAAATTAGNHFSRGQTEKNREEVKRWNRLTIAERSVVSFKAADLTGCDLTGINLKGVTSADRSSFTRTVLIDARLTASFQKASFMGATMTRVKLVGCECGHADFYLAKLSSADLSMSHFKSARFAEADLTGANLTGCALLGTDFASAKLSDAIFSGASFDNRTIWPTGFVPSGDMLWVGRGPDPRLSGKGKNAIARDINGLMTRLHTVMDPARIKKTIDMLQKDKQQLFFEIEPTMVRGVVRSQKDPDLVYSCVLMEDGIYSCSTPDVSKCMGLSNEPCKHILVLIIGLARAGLLDPTTADKWIMAAESKNPRWNKKVQNYICDSLIKDKGVVAGEVDWRPTETMFRCLSKLLVTLNSHRSKIGRSVPSTFATGPHH